VKGKGRGLILRYYPGICLEGLRKQRKTCQDRRSSGPDLNLEHPEYEAGVLTTRPRRSVVDVNQSKIINAGRLTPMCWGEYTFTSYDLGGMDERRDGRDMWHAGINKKYINI
jgi:hypothetical protein